MLTWLEYQGTSNFPCQYNDWFKVIAWKQVFRISQIFQAALDRANSNTLVFDKANSNTHVFDKNSMGE